MSRVCSVSVRESDSVTVDPHFADVYRRNYRYIYAYCRRRTDADRVDDAVAETFLVAWRKRDQLPDGPDILPWLYRVAYRVLLHQWRGAARRHRLRERAAGVALDMPALPEQHIVQNQEAQMVLEATARLRPIDQEILRLSLWEELSHAEIASVLDLQPAAVRKRLSRAVRNLTREFNRLEGRPMSTPVASKGGAR